VARVLAGMGMGCAGFLAFILFTFGPVARTLPAFPGGGGGPDPPPHTGGFTVTAAVFSAAHPSTGGTDDRGVWGARGARCLLDGCCCAGGAVADGGRGGGG
ncbi:hypothetical protein, partial [Salmonella enterica]|uniref:hypothetical protein n=1 Tax=Salmonella enterica TaxID=28901 RepID=UPI0006469FB3